MPKDKKVGGRNKEKAATNTNILKSKMIAALEKTLGVVTSAAKIANIDRTIHYDWLKSDPEYKQRVESIKDIALDFAESQLHKQIQDGEVSSTIFYLKTQGKNRGYIERTELEHSEKVIKLRLEDDGN